MSRAAEPSESMVTCPLCAARYRRADGQACHVACPLGRACQLLRCPHCGYEIPAPTRLTRWLSRWLGKAEAPP